MADKHVVAGRVDAGVGLTTEGDKSGATQRGIKPGCVASFALPVVPTNPTKTPNAGHMAQSTQDII